MSSVDAVRVERSGPLTTVILDRPAARNAVDGPTADALSAAFRDFDADPAASVAVLFGAGGTFCAGADLKAIGTDRGNRLDPDLDGDGPMGPTRMTLSKPVIAAVAGYAVAGGLELALWCDLRVVEADAVFGVFCRRWGVPLIDGGTVRLPRLIGTSRALDLILTGREVDAEEALRIGLVNEVVPSGTCVERALAWAEQIAALPQPAIRTDLEAAEKGWGRIDEGLDIEAEAFMRSIFRPETQEGLRRFAERDHPDLVP
jgi:enoyl-CoA hydratase